MDEIILAVWEYDDPTDLALQKAHWLAAHEGNALSVVGYSCSDKQPISPDELQALVSDVIGTDIKLVDAKVIAPEKINEYLLNTTQSGHYHQVVKTAAKYNEEEKDEADWKLIREMSQPLLLSMNRKWKREHIRVLATLDISDDNSKQIEMNKAVLSFAKLAQEKLDAQLHAAYVIAISKTLSELAIIESDEVLHKKGDAAHKALDKALADAGVSDVESHVLAGTPEDEITSLANKKKFDLVIIGSIGRKGLKGMLLGNTAEHTIKNLRQDLLVIKPKNTSTT